MAEARATVDETIEALTTRPSATGRTGPAPDWFGPVLFGGFVLGQATEAVGRSAPDGARVHSMLGYFLRPARAGVDIDYDVATIRDGRSFSSRRVVASQDGAPIFEAMTSFTTDRDAGYVYDLGLGDQVTLPSDLDVVHDDGPFAMADIGPGPVGPDGTRTSTRRGWMKVAATLPDDPVLHAAFLALASDESHSGARPHDLEHDTTGIVSLDHALWLHRPVRADEWFLYDGFSIVNAGGRGLFRATMRDQSGRVVASMAQEQLLTPI